MIVMMTIVGAMSLRGAERDSIATPLHLPDDVQSVLRNRCLDCHSGADAKGNTRLDNLPSLDLKTRLETRGTDSADIIQKRLINARTEIDQKHLYQHIIVNDILDKAIQDLLAIFKQYTSD